MRFDLKNMLVRQEIGKVALGVSEQLVSKEFGLPEWWEGKPKLSLSESPIWIYDNLQITFNKMRSVEKIAVYFADWSEPQKIHCMFSGSDLGPETSIRKIFDYMTDHQIPFNQKKNSIGDMELRVTKGATLTFKNKIDFEKSKAQERRVTTKEETLVSIVACQSRGK